MEPTTTFEATVSYAELREAVRWLAPHASKDGWAPILEGVHVYVQGAHLMLETTDRYTLARYRIPLVEDADNSQDFDVVVSCKALLDHLKLAKPPKGTSSLTMTLRADAKRVEFDAFYVPGFTLERMTGDYPAVHRLVKPHCTDVHANNAAGFVTLSLTNLLKFKPAPMPGGRKVDVHAGIRLTTLTGDTDVLAPIVAAVEGVPDLYVMVMPKREKGSALLWGGEDDVDAAPTSA